MGRLLALVLCIAVMGLGCGAKKPVATSAPVAATKDGSLYARLGGQKAIRAVVDEFVAMASADERVNFTRKGMGRREWQPTPENVEKLKVHLTQFITGVTGGPADAYKGKDMYAVHKGMKITNAQFDAAAEDLKAAMDKLHVGEKEEDELMAIVGGTRGGIVQQ